MGPRLVALVAYSLKMMQKNTPYSTQDSDVTSARRHSGPLRRCPGSASGGLGYRDWKPGPREETWNSNTDLLTFQPRLCISQRK